MSYISLSTRKFFVWPHGSRFIVWLLTSALVAQLLPPATFAQNGRPSRQLLYGDQALSVSSIFFNWPRMGVEGLPLVARVLERFASTPENPQLVHRMARAPSDPRPAQEFTDDEVRTLSSQAVQDAFSAGWLRYLASMTLDREEAAALLAALDRYIAGMVLPAHYEDRLQVLRRFVSQVPNGLDSAAASFLERKLAREFDFWQNLREIATRAPEVGELSRNDRRTLTKFLSNHYSEVAFWPPHLFASYLEIVTLLRMQWEPPSDANQMRRERSLLIKAVVTALLVSIWQGAPDHFRGWLWYFLFDFFVFQLFFSWFDATANDRWIEMFPNRSPFRPAARSDWNQILNRPINVDPTDMWRDTLQSCLRIFNSFEIERGQERAAAMLIAEACAQGYFTDEIMAPRERQRLLQAIFDNLAKRPLSWDQPVPGSLQPWARLAQALHALVASHAPMGSFLDFQLEKLEQTLQRRAPNRREAAFAVEILKSLGNTLPTDTASPSVPPGDPKLLAAS